MKNHKTPKTPPAERPPVDAEPEATTPKKGLRELVSRELDIACQTLARDVKANFEPDLIVGVVKGGVFAGEELATILGCTFVPVRIHERSRDTGTALAAQAGIPAEVAKKKVLIVDDIAGTGEALTAASQAAKAAGAKTIRTATLVVRAEGFRPDFFAVETDDLVVFPWDYEPTTGAVGSVGDDYQS